MSMGIGHTYWVEVIRSKTGDINDVEKFISDNHPENNKEWIDIKPYVNVKKGTCERYTVSLVKIKK